jgi:tetratricopeptide (TPR) repeat protein
MSGPRLWFTSLIALSLLLSAAAARSQGWNFVPTSPEYLVWPEHCRVQYSHINRGANDYGNAYSRSAVDALRVRAGAQTFNAAHHYCAALIYLRRLPFETDQEERAFLIRKALDEAAYSYVRAEPESFLYPNIAVVMAQARLENQQFDEAVAILNKTIADQPTRVEAYGALATIYHKQDNVTGALQVLKQADSALGGKSAEVKYNIGLMQLQLGQVDEAVDSARAAYGLGFPLPGLRNKLEQIGRTLNSPLTQ